MAVYRVLWAIAGILLRAYFYIRVLGKEGLLRVSEYATLNANYLLAELSKIGFNAAYPGRRASHEFILTLSPEKKAHGIYCHGTLLNVY